MPTTQYEGIVLYTDGAARPNPGHCGWGVHGYRYSTDYDDSKVLAGRYVATVQGYIATDKVTVHHTPVKVLEYYDLYGSNEGAQSNNVAEISALLQALKQIPKEQVQSLQVYTDSEYLRRGIVEWMPLWIQYDWKRRDGMPVQNQEIWRAILAELTVLKNANIQFRIDWVRGHAGILGNTLADKLAVIGVLYARDAYYVANYKVKPAKSYWKNDVQRHPMIAFKRLYFNSGLQYNTLGHYYIAEPGTPDDHHIGGKYPEAAYSVIRLKVLDPVIEAIRDYQCEVANTVNCVMLMRLDKVYSKDVYPYLQDHGRCALTANRRSSIGLNFVDDDPITVELRLGGLSLRAIENFGSLDELLDRYLALQNDPTSNAASTALTCHDITGLFYQSVTTKAKTPQLQLKPEYGVGYRDVMTSVVIARGAGSVTVQIPLILGGDLPSRNHLKQLETYQPRIQLVTWSESLGSLRYACVIETESGVGIWSNFFASRIYIPTEES